MSDQQAILDAGGLVPPKSKIKDGDQISARRYTHPALGHAVVRLTADNLAKGDDLEMDFLGFQTPEVNGPLALRRRQALGFPGWALIHDPQHARYALEIVKQFKKDVRRAKSKPGHAHDGFVAIAKQLGRSVAHFLPSFWEQVGREFMQLGNTTYAARAFGKAREAERVHALPVDENLRRDAFLEFALSGCLTIKSLTEYGKELEKAHDPLDAWKFFRELCVRRTLGGMPPWASMSKDIGRLLKATDLDAEAETLALLEEIIEAPAMVRAAAGFWKSYRKELKKLAQRDAKVAGLLLNLIPDTNDWENDFYWEWLDYLEEWELLPNLWKTKVPADARPDGGPGAWFERMIQLQTNVRQRAFDLLVKMADGIQKKGKPLQLAKKERWGDSHSIDVDLLDVALELGIEVADPPAETTMDLNDWAVPDDGAVDRPRDVTYVGRDPRFQEMLADAVGKFAGDPAFESAAEGKESLKAARGDWLKRLIRRLQEAALPAADVAMNMLENRTSRRTFQEFPDAYEALKRAVVAPALAITLRSGVIDEFGWKTLEEVIEKLQPQNPKKNLSFFGGAPHVIVTNGQQVVVVDPEGVVCEHELQLPKKARLEEICYCDGQLSVHYRNESYDNFFYWSDHPKKKYEESWRHSSDLGGFAVTMAEGGTFNGQRTIHAGDSKPPSGPGEFMADGEHFWGFVWEDGERELREINPQNGDKGRKSMPAFLEDYIVDGMKLRTEDCSLMHFGDLVKDSPLGQNNGLVGWRIRENRDKKQLQCEGVDGRQWSSYLKQNELLSVPSGMLQFPAAERANPYTSGSWRSRGQIWDAEGTTPIADLDEDPNIYSAGQAVVLPHEYWHFLNTRDAKTSAKLRKVTEAQADKLLQAAIRDIAQLESDQLRDTPHVPELPETAKAVDKIFPKVSDPRLRKGIVAIVFQAGMIANRLTELFDDRDPSGEDEAVDDNTIAALIPDAFGALDIDSAYGGEGLFAHLQTVSAFFAEGKKPKKVRPAPFRWFEILDGIESRIWKAYWEEKEEKSNWLPVVEAWTQLPLQDLPGAFRMIGGPFDDKSTYYRETDYNNGGDDEWLMVEAGKNRYLMSRDSWNDDWEILEYAPDGEFKPLDHLNIESESHYERACNNESLQAMIAAMQENDPPLLTLDRFQQIADEIGISRAEVSLIWCGFPHFRSWTKNFLPKELRTALDLKVSEASAAKESLNAIDSSLRAQLLARLLDGDPDEIWGGEQAAVDRFLSAWRDVIPARVSLPANLIEDLSDIAGYNSSVADVLEAMANPDSHPAIQNYDQGRITVEDGSVGFRTDDDSKSFNDEIMFAFAAALPMLFHELPVGDPARQAIGATYDELLKTLKQESLLLELASTVIYGDDDGSKILEKILGKLKKDKKSGCDVYDKGAILAKATKDSLVIAFRPAKVKGEKGIQELRNLFAAARDAEEYFYGRDTTQAFALLQSAGFKAIRKRIKKTPVPEGSFEANPLLSAPELVEEVAAHLSVSSEAACLYLQILALPDPTTKNVKLWNDWSTAQYNKAAKELVGAKLVLQAKRSRAGRNFFLEGGWEALKLPHLPTETWKLPLWGITRDSDGQLNIPLERIFCLQPIHETFAAAWQRILDGDEPKYEEVS